MERRRAKTREALLSAAQQLLSTSSAEGVNIDAIVELADVAKGTFYNYFADKEAIVREVEDGSRTHLETMIARTNATVSDTGARMARAFAAALHFALTDPSGARTLLRISPHTSDPETPINLGIRRDIREGLKVGRFKLVTEEAGVVLAIGVMQSAVSRALDVQDHAKVKALGENLATALLRGLGMPNEDAEQLAKAAMKAVG
jgi:AcrR family transcriptional regulator